MGAPAFSLAVNVCVELLASALAVFNW